MSGEIFVKIVLLSILLEGILFSSFFLPYIKTKFGDEKLNSIYSFISLCIRAAEQIYKSDEGKQKKLYVMQKAEKYLRDHGVTITMEQLDIIVEGLVNEIKYDVNYNK